MIRAVVDTNVFVSGFFWKGPLRSVFEAALGRGFLSVISDDIAAELRRVIDRPKFRKHLEQQRIDSAGLITAIRSVSLIVQPLPVPMDAVRDSKDRMILACAVGGQVDYVVSGDKDLLILGSYEGINVVSPVEFLHRLTLSMNIGEL